MNTNLNINVNNSIKTMLKKLEEEGNNIASSQILQTAMNLLMLAERNVSLENNFSNKANGFFERDLGTSLGNIKLKVPRDRNGDFRPSILPSPYQRDIEERNQVLQSLLEAGYSPNAVKNALHNLDMHYNPKELEQLKNEYLELYNQWSNRQLPQDVIALFIDVYHSHTKIDNKVKKTALYVIVGIDFDGKKDLFGLYLYQGHETKGFWLQTLNQIIERGLKRPLIIVSDDFSGLKDAVNTLFPDAFHQLCFIHMQRNVRKNMDKDDSNLFNKKLKMIRLNDDFENCKNEFIELCEFYQKKYPSFIKCLLNDTDNYFAFKNLPSDTQKHFYTTNIVESVNSILERLRGKMGGFFQSEDALCVNVYLSINQLSQRKWSKGVPLIKNNLYLLRQAFAQKYLELPKT